MQITIPFDYTEQVIPKRCRIPRGVKFHGQISVLIHEVTGEEAPIAIIEHTREFSEVTGNYGPKTIEYRWWSKRLWVLDIFNRYVRAPYETQTVEQFKNDPYPMVEGPPYYHAYRTKQENRIGIMGWARSVLFIDGMRYKQIAEPRYVINTFGLGHNHGGTGIFTENFYNSNISKTRYFRIDQCELAVLTAINIALNRGDNQSVPSIKERHDTFDILIPEAIRLNPAREHGEGDPFINKLEGLINKSPDSTVAGLLVMKEAINLIKIREK